MSIVLNPAAPQVATQNIAAQAVAGPGRCGAGRYGRYHLQPGTVINAQVLQLLGNDQVRIAIGGQALDVVSQVPLQAGQTLQLAVSQASDGNINLAVINQPAAPAGVAAANSATVNATADAAALATVTTSGRHGDCSATEPAHDLAGACGVGGGRDRGPPSRPASRRCSPI